MPKIDGRRGWVVVATCFIICMISDGMMYSFGIMFVEILDAFKKSKSFTSGIGGLMYGMGIVAPLAGWLINKYGCRTGMILGGLMSSAGFITSAWSTGVLFMYISIGLIAGFGLIILDFTKDVIIVQNFKKKRSLAYGITTFGSGLGSVVFNPISKWLIDTYGWRGTLLIEGGISLNCAILGLLIRRVSGETEQNVDSAEEGNNISRKDDEMQELEQLNQKKSDKGLQDIKNNRPILKHKSHSQKSKTKKNTRLSLLKQPPFLIYMLSGFFSGLAFPVPFTFIPDLSISTGYTRSQAVLLMTVVGIANTATRIPFGLIMDSKYFNRTFVYGICCILTGISVASMPYLRQYWLFLTICGHFGFFSATMVVLGTLVSADLFGDDLIADTRGFITFIFGVGTLISGPLTGLLFDVTGNYKAAFILCGCTNALEGLLRIQLYVLSRRKRPLIVWKG